MKKNKINSREIKNFVREIRKSYKPEKVILFGSYAHGKPKKASDVDLLVVAKDKRKMSDIVGDLVIDRLSIGGPYFSVKIYDPKTFKSLNSPPTFFMRHVSQDGVEL